MERAPWLTAPCAIREANEEPGCADAIACKVRLISSNCARKAGIGATLWPYCLPCQTNRRSADLHFRRAGVLVMPLPEIEPNGFCAKQYGYISTRYNRVGAAFSLLVKQRPQLPFLMSKRPSCNCWRERA
jgi:hypothetical protein